MIFNIQRFSTHDGPGIRTVVFLKGCPLRCAWCENPEGQSLRAELFYDERLCIGCLDCYRAASDGEITISGEKASAGMRPCLHRHRVRRPEKFRGVCPTQALTVVGEEQEFEWVLGEVEKDRAFYRHDGGVTLSGGEPFVQPRLVLGLLEKLRERQIDTVVETSLESAWDTIEPALPFLSLLLADLKHIDEAVYRAATGGHLSRVMDNFRRLAESRTKVIVRVPVIPGFNDDEFVLDKIAQYAASLSNVEELHLLPYHTLGKGKYHNLGRSYAMDGLPLLSQERLAACARTVEARGLRVRIGG